MAFENMFTDASSVMTVINLVTFIGILWWTFGVKRSGDFDAVAHLPFADDVDGAVVQDTEKHHG